jgi:mannitol/fructose-specific phosphotransferase system IIA component (Ntr-type)
MRISDILTTSRITQLDTPTKREAIEQMVDLLARQGDVTDRQRALQAVLDREMTRTTGIGGGLGIPHGKTAAVSDIVMALGRARTPIAFDSVDGAPVDLVLMLISPTSQAGPHIQALARISRLMSSELLRRKLREAESSQDMLDVLRRHETEFA